MESAVLVGIGGAIGAVLRYAVGEYVERETFPLSVLVVNVSGSFVAGLIAFAPVDGDAALLVGVGICGSFTTFSSFSFQAVHLWENDRRAAAVVHAVGNLLACLAAVGLAWVLASSLPVS